MDMPRPTAAHKALERLVGQWTANETMHPSPFDPGGPAIGRTVNRGVMGMVRASWDLGVADRIAYLMEVSGDGTSWMPFIEATYTRAR